MSNEKEPKEIGDWWSAPAQAENNDRLIIVTGRRDVKKFRENPRFNIRIEVTMKYEGLADGMPTEETSKLLEEITDRFQEVLRRDPIAVITGIFTGDDERNWIFYSLSTHIFEKKLNEALSPFPLLPITVYAENDPDWQAYDEMLQTEIKLD